MVMNGQGLVCEGCDLGLDILSHQEMPQRDSAHCAIRFCASGSLSSQSNYPGRRGGKMMDDPLAQSPRINLIIKAAIGIQRISHRKTVRSTWTFIAVNLLQDFSDRIDSPTQQGNEWSDCFDQQIYIVDAGKGVIAPKGSLGCNLIGQFDGQLSSVIRQTKNMDKESLSSSTSGTSAIGSACGNTICDEVGSVWMVRQTANHNG